MIRKALKFQCPSLIKLNLSSFTHLRPSMEDSQSILTEARIKECKYPADILYSISNEKSLTPQLLNQYCFKLSSMFIREKPKNNLFKMLEIIRKTDRKNLTLQELSNYAAICTACIDINLNDHKLFNQILGQIRRHLRNKEEVQALPLYALINIYQYCTKNEFPSAVSDLVQGIFRYFKEDRFSVNDFCIVSKIMSERINLIGKEKILLIQLLKKIKELYQEDYLNISPKIRLYASIRAVSFFEPFYTNQAKFLKQMIEFLEKDLIDKIEDMNQQNVMLLLRELPPNNPVCRIIVSQITENINQDGSSQIPSQLLSKLLKIYSNRHNFKKMKKQNYDSILKMYQKNLHDINYNYPRDLLQLIRNRFFPRNQIQMIQKLFLEKDVLQGDIEYVYECLNNNIIFQDYTQYAQTLSTSIMDIQDKIFPVTALSLKKLCKQFPQNQQFKELYNQYLDEIKNKFPNRVQILKKWKAFSPYVLENFLNEFGDIFVDKMFENVLKAQKPWNLHNQFMLMLFLGNGSRFMTADKINSQTAKHVLSYALNTLEIAQSRIPLVNRMILICLKNLQENLSKKKKQAQNQNKKQVKIKPNGREFKEFDFNIAETLFFRKVLAYLSNKQINLCLKPYEADNFIQIALVLLQKFPNITEQERGNELIMGMLIHLRQFVRETKSYEEFLKQLSKHHQIIGYQNQLAFFISFFKKACIFDGPLADFSIKKLQKNNKDIIYLEAISGNISSLTNVSLSINCLSTITYLGSRHIQANESFLSENLQTIFQFINETKSPQAIIQAFGHLDNSQRIKRNTTIYQIMMKLLEKLTLMIQDVKVRHLNLVRPIKVVLQNLKEFSWANNKTVFKFLMSYTDYAISFVYDIPGQIHHLLLLTCLQNRVKNQKYLEALLQFTLSESFRPYSYLLPKFRILSQISSQHQVSSRYFELNRISTHVIMKFDRIIFNLLKNMLLRNNSEEMLAQVKKFLKMVKNNLQISETDAKYLSKKFNGQMDEVLREIKIFPIRYKNPKYIKIKEFIIKLAQSNKVSYKIFEEAGQQMIQIEDSYIYIDQNNNPLTFLNQIEYISTLFKDKFVAEKDNILILGIKKQNFKNTITTLQKNCPSLVKNVEQASQMYFQQAKDEQQAVDEEDQQDD